MDGYSWIKIKRYVSFYPLCILLSLPKALLTSIGELNWFPGRFFKMSMTLESALLFWACCIKSFLSAGKSMPRMARSTSAAVTATISPPHNWFSTLILIVMSLNCL